MSVGLFFLGIQLALAGDVSGMTFSNLPSLELTVQMSEEGAIKGWTGVVSSKVTASTVTFHAMPEFNEVGLATNYKVSSIDTKGAEVSFRFCNIDPHRVLLQDLVVKFPDGSVSKAETLTLPPVEKN